MATSSLPHLTSAEHEGDFVTRRATSPFFIEQHVDEGADHNFVNVTSVRTGTVLGLSTKIKHSSW
jgi:hypothetical protein